MARVNAVEGFPHFRVKLGTMPEFSTSAEASQEVPQGVIDGVNTKFTLTNSPIPNSEHIYKNGMFMSRNGDYTINGKEITFLSPPVTNSIIAVNYKYGRDK